MRAALYLGPKDRERQPGPLVLRGETFRGQKFERDSRQMLGSLGHLVESLARRGIVYFNPARRTGLEDHEMGHVPMGDGRKPELLQLLHLEAHGARPELKVACDLDKAAQRDALQRNWVSAPQRVQVNAV